jgi:4-hydroxybenzoyl-CoA thioesterase
MFVNRRAVTIEWGDCDPAGIVFYPRYFVMFDSSTSYLFEAALGYNKFEMLRRFGVIGYPMVDTGAKFFIPSKFGDVIIIETRIEAFRRSSFDVAHRLLRTDGGVAIEAYETRVWAARHPEDPERIKAVSIPDEIVEKLSAENW